VPEIERGTPLFIAGNIRYSINQVVLVMNKVKSKTIPVTGRGALYECVILRIKNCIDRQWADNLKHRPRSAETLFSASGTHFC
jgi:hypothetical protein